MFRCEKVEVTEAHNHGMANLVRVGHLPVKRVKSGLRVSDLDLMVEESLRHEKTATGIALNYDKI